MKIKTLTTPILGAFACSILSAQIVFVDNFDYDTPDGDRELPDTENWQFGPGFIIPEGGGSVIFPSRAESPGSAVFQTSVYSGNRAFTSNDYSMSMTFTMSFADESWLTYSSARGGSNELGALLIDGPDTSPIYATVRQTNNAGQFDILMRLTTPGDVGSIVSSNAGFPSNNPANFMAAQIGISEDEGVWNLTSDLLQLNFSVKYTGLNQDDLPQWELSASLFNLDVLNEGEPTLLASRTQTVVETSSNFRDSENEFRLNARDIPSGITFVADSVTLIPEPSTYAAILGLVALGGILYRRRRG